jgi:hypothetical protein
MGGIGVYLAILGAPALGGIYLGALAALVAAGRIRPIDEVVPNAQRAREFGTMALAPVCLAGFVLALVWWC